MPLRGKYAAQSSFMAFAVIRTGGKQYRVERSETYPSDQWSIVKEHVPGTGGIVQVLDPTGLSFPKCFYRVSLIR